jgi:formylglycine-generating enzyme required for sulfatase activity
MEFVIVPAGSYQMGDVWGDEFCRDLGDSCKPVHQVEMQELQLGKYPVSQAQWLAVMGGENPAEKSSEEFVDPDKPVINVSWDDAQSFVTRLNGKTENRFGYRLPSEAEWEYAARSGGNRDKWSGTSDISRLSEYACYRQRSTLNIGQKRPNSLGLHDMSGNVWEWCQDLWHDTYDGAPSDGSAWMTGGDEKKRVLRGGCWCLSASFCRSARRSWRYRFISCYNLGLRIALDSK